MKIGIWAGCANGGMMDSLSISPFSEDDGEPDAVYDCSYAEWTEWKAHLKEHTKWARFWNDKLYCKKNRYTP